MELKIKEALFPEVIEFNFEELKAEITERAGHYKTLVYTPEQIPAAKKDLATLRKLSKALNDAKVAEKKKCLKPYEAFENQVKELLAIIGEPIQMIDMQVKGYEEQRKQEKHGAIIAYYEGLNHPDWLRFERIFDEKWLNATAKPDAIRQEITAKLEAIEKDLATLAELPEYGFEALEAYKDTLDINKAIQEGKRLATMAKLAEHARQEMQVHGSPIPENPVPAAEPEITPEEVEQLSEAYAEIPADDPPESYDVRAWINFSAYLNHADAVALNAFFKSRKIEFRQI